MMFLRCLAGIFMWAAIALIARIIQLSIHYPRNTTHLGKGWYSDRSWTKADKARAEQEQTEGAAAAVESGAIAPLISAEMFDELLHHGSWGGPQERK